MPTEIAYACAFRNYNISHENFAKGRFSRLISGSASPPRPGLCLAKGNPNVVGTPSIAGTLVCVLGHVGVLGAGLIQNARRQHTKAAPRGAAPGAAQGAPRSYSIQFFTHHPGALAQRDLVTRSRPTAAQ